MRRRHLPLLAVGAWCALAAAQTSVNFEAGAGYAAGQPLGGQQGWSEYINNGATMTVYSGDNGPSGAGSQCVELRTVSGAGEMGVELQFPDAVANGGRLITIRYDYRRVVTDTAAQCAIRLLSPNTQHWWDHWNQYVGYLDHEGNGGSWSGREWPVQDDQWHTIEWQFVWGDKYAGENGYLVYDSFDGLKKTDHARCYMHPNYTDDVSFVRLWILDAYWNLDYRDVIRIDNLVVSGAPLPSRIPVADAGADQSLPGNWEGVPVTLDASASHDPDGQITRYVWRYQLEVLYDGPQARPTVMLDPAVRYDLLLQVFDDTGLM
ncbi:MAG: PKD domain-containing protein, partial [Planctomycetota bacterium]